MRRSSVVASKAEQEWLKLLSSKFHMREDSIPGRSKSAAEKSGLKSRYENFGYAFSFASIHNWAVLFRSLLNTFDIMEEYAADKKIGGKSW